MYVHICMYIIHTYRYIRNLNGKFIICMYMYVCNTYIHLIHTYMHQQIFKRNLYSELYTCIHICMYIIHTDRQAYIHTYISYIHIYHTYKHTYISYIHTYIHTYLTYIHTYVCIYIYTVTRKYVHTYV